MPEKIYHYCSIETLEKILRYKTIRFTRFDLMDDRTETDGLPEMLKKKYFLSCWVSDDTEKIPQWALYAPKGVRIEMPQKWYKKYSIPVANSDQLLEKVPAEKGHPAEHMFFPIPFNEWFELGKKFFFVPPLDEQDGFFTKVVYDQDFLELKRKFWSPIGHTDGISLNHQSAPIKFKDQYWSFQDEVRFYLLAVSNHEDRHEIPEFIDLPLNAFALSQLKVRMYPNCSPEDSAIVKKIIDDYFPALDSNQIVENSLLDGKYFPKIY